MSENNCMCYAIMSADPSRHFKECPKRAEHPVAMSGPERIAALEVELARITSIRDKLVGLLDGSDLEVEDLKASAKEAVRQRDAYHQLYDKLYLELKNDWERGWNAFRKMLIDDLEATLAGIEEGTLLHTAMADALVAYRKLQPAEGREERYGICGFPTAPGEFCEFGPGHDGDCGRGSRVPK